MNKFLLIAVASFATLTLAANPLKGWTNTRSDLAKNNPASVKIDAKSITLTGIPKVTWSYFTPAAVKAVKDQKVEITLKASGKGKVQVGFYEYRRGFSHATTTLQNVALTDKMETKKITLTVKHKETTIFRPTFFIAPDARIVITEFNVKVADAKK